MLEFRGQDCGLPLLEQPHEVGNPVRADDVGAADESQHEFLGGRELGHHCGCGMANVWEGVGDGGHEV